MSRKKRSQAELQQVSEHLHYELGMLLSVADGLASGVAGESPLKNALVESFAVHVRNLVDFLWPSNPKNDHVTAADFFKCAEDWQNIQPELPQELKKSHRRAAKEIAHLSYDRIRVTFEAKQWHFVRISQLLLDSIRVFLKHVPKDNLAAKWHSDVQES